MFEKSEITNAQVTELMDTHLRIDNVYAAARIVRDLEHKATLRQVVREFRVIDSILAEVEKHAHEAGYCLGSDMVYELRDKWYALIQDSSMDEW